MTKVEVGAVFPTTKSGNITILEYHTSKKVKVKFLDTSTEKFCSAGDIRKGQVRDPKSKYGKLVEGDIYRTKTYGALKILEDRGTLEVLVEFITTGYRTTSTRYNIKSGMIKDVMLPSIYGIGFLGDGSYKAKINGRLTTAYRKWCGLLCRCYGESGKGHWDCYKHGKITVCKSWHNFQVFAEWFYINSTEGWDLDKDFKGGREYSENNCIFIPPELNKILINGTTKSQLPIGVTKVSGGKGYTARCCRQGNNREYLGVFACPDTAFLAYKEAKEANIKRVANRYKNTLTTEVYDTIIRYEVNDNSDYKDNL